MELHNTGYGRKLLESDIPGIRKALERIADALEDKQRILNTPKNSTVEDMSEVIDAIEKIDNEKL